MSTPRTIASQPLRTLRSLALACTLPAFAVACSGAADTMAPYSAIDGGVPRALVNETGAGMVCGTDAPVTASLTTVDRRGRTVAAAGEAVRQRKQGGRVRFITRRNGLRLPGTKGRKPAGRGVWVARGRG